VLEGGPAFATIGAGGQSTGTKLFCLSGNVAEPGVYEVPFGKTLRDLIDMAGGRRRRSFDTGDLAGWRGRRVRRSERAGYPAHLRGRSRREGDPSAPVSSSCSTTAPICRTCSCGSHRSSATSPAGNACPVAWERFGRRGSLPNRQRKDDRRRRPRGRPARRGRPRHEGRIDLRTRPNRLRAIESAIHRVGLLRRPNPQWVRPIGFNGSDPKEGRVMK
jgi:hypothetical protein